MNQLQAGFDQLNLSWIPSVGNFICFAVPGRAMDIFQGLLEKGVIIRPVANYEMPDHLRVSIGTQAENQQFLLALKSLLGV